MGGKARVAVVYAIDWATTGADPLCGQARRMSMVVAEDAHRVTCKRCLRGMRAKGLRMEGK